MADNPFTRHPTQVGERYGEHLRVAFGFGLRMIGGGLACLVHGLCPFLFERTASETVRGLNRTLCRRAEAPNWERHPII
ncbi:MAG TPA: DUF6356 family protein [Allosphingosinicella sp.]|nr:DUF6356 family protein [Allosphingosinicella sp.]